jgi:oxaloacetate decarboxylase (Na+ extruding) subunit gamma
MIVEGLKLMVVGMTTVLLFLMFMILLIQLVAHLTKGVTARELQAMEDERAQLKREREREKLAADDSDEDIVVITAAIAAFEAERAAIPQ